MTTLAYVGGPGPGTFCHWVFWNTTGTCLLVMPAAVFVRGNGSHDRHRVLWGAQSVMKYMELDIVRLAIHFAGNVGTES
jgi:hypothetical protein